MLSNAPARKRTESSNSEILDVCLPIVRSTCRRYLRRHHDVEDAIQDTFLKMVLHGMDGTRPKLAGWLSTAAYTSCIDQIRRDRSEQRRRVERSRVRWPDDEEVLVREENCHRVELAMQRLDEPSKKLLVDRYYNGMPLRAIAERVGIAISTVSRRAINAEKALGRRFKDCELEESGAPRV